jgi:hypothetical protein
MTNHVLIRDRKNLPMCACGYRPEILNQASPVGIQWKAKADVANHVDDMRRLNAPATATRSPDAPFRLQAWREVEFPRAGVRQTEDGRWLLTLWDSDRVLHVIDEPVFEDRVLAFDYAALTVGACRQSGTNLNGWATV